MILGKLCVSSLLFRKPVDMAMSMLFSVLLFAAVSLFGKCQAGSYVHQEGWPRGMPELSHSLSAVGVDPYVLGGAEIYIAQRGANVTPPILVFNEAGDLVRSFGASDIARDANGNWGCHGLSVRASPTKETEIWVNDFDEFTTKVFSSTGKLLARLGTKGQAGTGLDPLQFGKVADTAFGGKNSNKVYISDGDGSSNHRVYALEVDNFALYNEHNFRGNAVKNVDDFATVDWVGGNNNTKGAFSDSVFGLPLTSMHSVDHHMRTDTLFAADRENNRTLHIDAKTGIVKGEWTVADTIGTKARSGFETVYCVRTFFSPRYNLDLVVLAMGDMDATDTPPKQGVYILDGSGVTVDGPGKVKAPLQTISVDSSLCLTPHLMGFNEVNGDLYLACVGANSAVWRYQYK